MYTQSIDQKSPKFDYFWLEFDCIPEEWNGKPCLLEYSSILGIVESAKICWVDIDVKD